MFCKEHVDFQAFYDIHCAMRLHFEEDGGSVAFFFFFIFYRADHLTGAQSPHLVNERLN